MKYSFISTIFTLHFILFSVFYSTANGVFCEKMTDTIELKRARKTSHLHFYFHDIVSGNNSTVVKIAGPKNSGLAFGNTMMMDDALTEGPELSSKLVGRAQGIYGFAEQNGESLLMVMNFVFTEGEHKGSSISILGKNHFLDDVREMPVVGGSGVFKFASGYALAHTISLDFITGDATVEYNVYVSHY